MHLYVMSHHWAALNAMYESRLEHLAFQCNRYPLHIKRNKNSFNVVIYRYNIQYDMHVVKS